jgi:hypothetical protein
LAILATSYSTFTIIYASLATGCAMFATVYLVLGKFNIIPATVWATPAKLWAILGTTIAKAATNSTILHKNRLIFGKKRAISAYHKHTKHSFSIIFIHPHHSLTYP